MPIRPEAPADTALLLTLVLPELGFFGTAILGFSPDALLRPHCCRPPERRPEGTAWPIRLAAGTGFYTAPFDIGGTPSEIGLHVLNGTADGGQVVLTLPVVVPPLLGTRLQDALPGRCEPPRYGNSPQGIPGAHWRMTLRRGDRLSIPLSAFTLTLEVG